MIDNTVDDDEMSTEAMNAGAFQALVTLLAPVRSAAVQAARTNAISCSPEPLIVYTVAE